MPQDDARHDGRQVHSYVEMLAARTSFNVALEDAFVQGLSSVDPV